MTDRVFVDTNVLVYTRDASEPSKQKEAMVLDVPFMAAKDGAIELSNG